MASANAAESPGDTRSPDTPSAIASGVPPTRVATVGALAAIDSSTTFDNASFNDGMTDTVELASTAGTSDRRPVKWTRSPMPRRAANSASTVK